MNKESTIKRQLIAGCLVAVFLFITAVKLFHSHDNVKSYHFSSTVGQVGKSSDCSICDYHIPMDATVTMENISINKPQLNVTPVFFYQSRKPSSVGLSYADRGPPALA